MKKNMIISSVLCATMLTTPITALAVENEPKLIATAVTEEKVIVGVPQITVNGEAIDLSKSNLSQYLFEENGNVMVPLRAIAEKMGYTVTWNGENSSFSVENDTWKVTAYIDEDHYYGVTKIENAVGMTAPQSYGTAPQLVEDRTFVPAKMFELMGYSYTSVGQFVNFTNVHTIIDNEGNEYSNNTLIISVAPDAKKSDITKLFEAKRLEIINEMNNLKMYTVKLEKPMTADEMDMYIDELEKSECIVAVSKNYIMHLDEVNKK